MKKSIITIWKNQVNWILISTTTAVGVSLIGIPTHAITTTETLLGNIPSYYSQQVLTNQGDVLATYIEGEYLRVFTYDSQTGQTDHWELAHEQDNIYLDFIQLQAIESGSVFVSFKYQADPVLHYNVWNGSGWDYATTQYQTFACGTLPHFSTTSIDDRIILTYRTVSCLTSDEFYQALKEYNTSTKQWSDYNLDHIDATMPLTLITTSKAVFVGHYYYVGINYPNPPTSFLYVWRENEGAEYIALPLHTHTFASKEVRTYDFIHFFDMAAGYVALAGNDLEAVMYDSTSQAYYNLKDLRSAEPNNHSTFTVTAATLDARSNLIMLMYDGPFTHNQVYRWDGNNFELLDLDLHDGDSGAYTMTTLSDGRLFLLANGDIYQYALTWDGDRFSKAKRLNKNRIHKESITPSIELNYSAKPYVVFKYSGKNDVRLRAWDNGVLRPVVVFKRWNKFVDGVGTVDGQFGLIATSHGNYNRRRFWDSEQHRFVASYDGHLVMRGPQQLSATEWQTLELSSYLTKKETYRTKLRLFTTRFD